MKNVALKKLKLSLARKEACEIIEETLYDFRFPRPLAKQIAAAIADAFEESERYLEKYDVLE